MRELLQANQIIQITDNNSNQLPTLVAIIAVIYILYAFLSVIFNKKRLKKLQEWKSELEQRK